MKIKILISIFVISLQIFINSQAQATQLTDNPPKSQIKSIQILKDQAIISYKKGNYKEALTYLENIDSNNFDEETLILAANCYDKDGNTDKAIEYLQRVLEINPNNSYAYYNLGIINFNNGNTAIAINNFTRAIKANKKFNAAYYNLGISYYNVKDYKKALKYFNKAHKLNPDNQNICYNLALTYETLGNVKKAQKYFDLYDFLSNVKN